MRALTAPKYRHFVPQSSELIFRMPSLSIDGSNTLMYQYSIFENHQLSRQVLPQALWGSSNSSVQVFVNGVLQKRDLRQKAPSSSTEIWDLRTAWAVEDKFLVTNYVYLNTYSHILWGQLDNWRNYEIGDIVLVKSTMSFDGWYHLDIRRLLIQGANPASNNVLSANQMFQGGYRLEYHVIAGPVYGQLRRCDTQLGWDYKPPPGYRGIDSFSYYLTTEFGQRSEPRCCSLYVG